MSSWPSCKAAGNKCARFPTDISARSVLAARNIGTPEQRNNAQDRSPVMRVMSENVRSKLVDRWATLFGTLSSRSRNSADARDGKSE